MAQINPGNELYLYDLLARELGMGAQTPLARMEEALAADGVAPLDLACADARELADALGFLKVTAFKKGSVYVTVLASEEFDQALEALGEADKPAPAGKPWKRRKKTLKPVKPVHVEEPEPPAAPEEPPVILSKAKDLPERSDDDAQSTVEDPSPSAQDDVEGQADAVEPEPAPEPEPEPEPAPEPAPKLNITYTPEPRPTHETPAPGAFRSDLPRDFHADLRVPTELLSLLYQSLPGNVSPIDTLEEDFSAALAANAATGSRSTMTFPLRFERADGAGPMTATIHRFARPAAGKHWALTQVDAG